MNGWSIDSLFQCFFDALQKHGRACVGLYWVWWHAIWSHCLGIGEAGWDWLLAKHLHVILTMRCFSLFRKMILPRCGSTYRIMQCVIAWLFGMDRWSSLSSQYRKCCQRKTSSVLCGTVSETSIDKSKTCRMGERVSKHGQFTCINNIATASSLR